MLRSLRITRGRGVSSRGPEINRMQLAPAVFNRSIDADETTVRAEVRMCVDSPFPGISFGQVEPAQINVAAAGHVVEV